VDQKQVGFALGAADYLVKPIRKPVLLETIRKHVPHQTDDDAAILLVDDDLLAFPLGGKCASSVVQCRFNFSAAANVIGSQPSATRNQCRLTIAVQKATVVIERVVFPLFQVS
jgi:DNA-binding response OmpR family regulator